MDNKFGSLCRPAGARRQPRSPAQGLPSQPGHRHCSSPPPLSLPGACCTLPPAGSFPTAGGAVVALTSLIPPDCDPLAILILGPTGSGKTALSLALGEHFNGEIVSCDSVAVYRGMDLGSAKPSAEEQRRLPHHLIDVANPDQPFTAGEYSRQARAALRKIAAPQAICPSSPAAPASISAR